MSTHTIYFCDGCNADHDIDYDGSDKRAITHSGLPTMDGWAEFRRPFTNYAGRQDFADVHVCAHCVEDPDFEPEATWSIAEWDTDSKKNYDRGRVVAERVAWALEHLVTRDDRGWRRGVRPDPCQELSYWFGPRLENGKFEARDRDLEPAGASR